MPARQTPRRLHVLWPILLALAGLTVLLVLILKGTNIAVLNPKGLIAQEQFNLILLICGIIFTIATPTIAFLYYVAWKYRESNDKAKRDPTAGHGKLFNVFIWVVPAGFMAACGVILWIAAHNLEPQKQIASNNKPILIQVVAQRWKWLFIYPTQGIASVNYVQLPADTPVTFELTADETPMTSFWIPNLGGMLYAMTGHVNRLNLLPQTLGEYTGKTAEINGEGFADMTFTAKITSKDDFIKWVQGVEQHSPVLSSTEYANLLKPSVKNPPTTYGTVDADLYGTVLHKYAAAHSHEEQGHE